MTPYEATYETKLEDALRELAAKWLPCGQAARDDFIAKLEKTGDGGWGFEGAFGYHLGWDQGKVVEAETKTKAGQFILQMFDGSPDDGSDQVDRSDVTATFVASALKKNLDRCIADGITTSSTSETSNLVARLRGKAAIGIKDGLYSDGLDYAVSVAKYHAVDALVGNKSKDFRTAVNDRKAIVSKLDRAKAESTITRLNRELEAAHVAVSFAALELVNLAEAAGIPMELLPDEAVKLARPQEVIS